MCELTGNPDLHIFLLGNLATILRMQCDWPAAHDLADRALDLTGAGGRAYWGANPRLELGMLCLCEGKYEEARRHMEETITLAEEAGDAQLEEAANAGLARLEVYQGQPQAARDRLEAFPESQDTTGLVDVVAARVQVYLALNDLEAADAASTRAMELTREEPLFRAASLLDRGMVLARQKRYDEASQALQDGLELAQPMGDVYLQAKLMVEQGLIRIAQGQIEDGRDLLSAATQTFRMLGAKEDVRGTEELLHNSREDETPSPGRALPADTRDTSAKRHSDPGSAPS